MGVLLIGAAVGTFFTGSAFALNEYNQVTWQTSVRGLEAATNLFNLAFGLFLVFLGRTLGGMYLLNNIVHEALNARCRRSVLINFLWTLPFLFFVLISLVTMDGYAVNPETLEVFMEKGKYLHNLLAMPLLLVFLLAGLGLVIYGVFATSFKECNCGIWFAGLGTVLTALVIFLIAGYNNTSFYPSYADLQSSLTIYNASSSKYTLTAMTYVALGIPFVLAYVAYVWRLMDSKKLTPEELTEGENAHEMY